MTVTLPYDGTFNGLTWGPTHSLQLGPAGYGTGLRSLPQIRSGDQAKARQNNYWAGLNVLGERIWVTTFDVFSPSISTETLLAQVSAAFQNIADPRAQLPFEFILPGWANSRFLTCRPTKANIPVDLNYQFGVVEIPVEFTANDPLLYSSVLKTASTGLPSPTAGLTFPVTFNVTFGASTGGSMSVTNAGNYITAPVFTITGPVTNPAISFPATGQFFTVAINLIVGDTLVIDMAAHTVTLNGTASRYNLVTTGSSWFGIPPGTWSIGVASTDSSPVAALFTTTWRDAWGFA